MVPVAADGYRLRRAPQFLTAMTYRFLAPVLSAQFMTAATGMASDMRNLLPPEPPEPRFDMVNRWLGSSRKMKCARGERREERGERRGERGGEGGAAAPWLLFRTGTPFGAQIDGERLGRDEQPFYFGVSWPGWTPPFLNPKKQTHIILVSCSFPLQLQFSPSAIRRRPFCPALELRSHSSPRSFSFSFSFRGSEHAHVQLLQRAFLLLLQQKSL